MNGSLPFLEINLLGRFRILQDGAEVAGFRSQQAKELLALLVVENGLPVPFARLALDLSGANGGLSAENAGTANDPSARNCLRVGLNRLVSGRSADSDTSKVRLDSGRLRKEGRAAVALDVSNARIDVLRFVAAAGTNEPSAQQAAVELYTGDLLPECEGKAISRLRDELRGTYRVLLDGLATQAKAIGDFASAVRYLRLRIESEPANEQQIERLMDVLIQWNAEAAAIEDYSTYERSLRRGCAPGRALRAKRATLAQDLPRGNRQWLPAPSARLTGPLPAIIGRDADLLRLLALLDNARFVTLKGAPGAGKTLLALHLAARLMSTFNNRVAFIDLTECTTAGDVERRIAACMDVAPDTPISWKCSRHSVGSERVLIILDNCERFVALTGDLVANMLRRLPNSTLIGPATRHGAMFPASTSSTSDPLRYRPPACRHLPRTSW